MCLITHGWNRRSARVVLHVFRAMSALGACSVPACCGLAALKAAGLMGTVPPGGALFESLIRTLQQDAEWFIATGIGLGIILISGLMAFGSQRAPEYFFRVAFGIAGILILAPAVMA
jgi:hypothetical protein